MDTRKEDCSEDSKLISDKYVKKKGLSVLKASIMIAGATAGSGILTLPSAAEATGLLGPFLLVALAALSGYSGTVLGWSWAILEQRTNLDTHTQDPYPLLGEKTMGKFGRVIVKICIYTYSIGVGVVSLLATADLIFDLLRTLENVDFSICYISLIVGGIMVPLNWLGTPVDFWLFGLLAILSTAGAGVVIAGYTFYLSIEEIVPSPVVHAPISVGKYFLAVGTMNYALACHPVYPNVQQDMNERSKFDRAIVFSTIAVASIFLLVMMTTYFILGSVIGPNILVTLTGIQPGWPVQLAELLLLIHYLTSMLVNLNPINQDLEDLFNVPNELCLGRILIRTVVVAVILFIAESIPRFALLLSLFGGSTNTAIAFIIPLLMYEILCRQNGSWEKVTIPRYLTAVHVLIMLFGTLIFVSSTYFAFFEMWGPDTFVLPCYMNVTTARI